jgi:hypothetical protein
MPPATGRRKSRGKCNIHRYLAVGWAKVNSPALAARRNRMRLSGRTVIVTGGAAGIGATYSAGLVREGAVVYLADIADGAALAAGLSDPGPGRAVFVRTDVGDEGSVRRGRLPAPGNWLAGRLPPNDSASAEKLARVHLI